MTVGGVVLCGLRGSVFGFLFALHPAFGELFHHFDEFLAVVFE